MRRNPRRSPTAGYATTVTSAILVCLAVAVALLGHIRLKGELNRLDLEISRLDTRLAEVRAGIRKLQDGYDQLVSPTGLERRIEQLRLDLAPPGDKARVVLPEPPAGPAGMIPVPLEGRAGHLALNSPMPSQRPPRP